MLILDHCERSVRGWAVGAQLASTLVCWRRQWAKHRKCSGLTSRDQSCPLLVFMLLQAVPGSHAASSLRDPGNLWLCSVPKGQNIYVPACHPVHVETLENPSGRESSHGREICSVLDVYCQH